MKELMEGKSQLIAATNALGMGVDLPDIRVVIYAGQLRKLRDYAQESGRAGRDGQSSEAIIVCCQVESIQLQHWLKSWAQSKGGDIADFVARYNCRRIIIDRIMDGRMDRVGCEEGEEQCDVCWSNQQVDLPIAQLPACSTSIVCSGCKELPRLERSRECLIPSAVKFEDSGIGNSISSQAQESRQVQESTMPSSPPIIDSSPISEDNGFINHSPIPGRFQTVQEEAEMQTMFEQQQRERQWLASRITKQRREEGQEIAEFEAALRKWANRCPLCKLQGKQQQQHRLEDCKQAESETVLRSVQTMTEEMQGKKRFAKFSCCFDCGVPQAICQK
jgi:superfamily II DNA helicase RecQ